MSMAKQYIQNNDLLNALLTGPYSHYEKYGDDDWRDPEQKNPSLSISSKGYIDHKFGKSGSLFVLCREHNLPIVTYKDHSSQKVTAQTIWDKSEVTNKDDSKSFQLAAAFQRLENRPANVPVVYQQHLHQSGWRGRNDGEWRGAAKNRIRVNG